VRIFGTDSNGRVFSEKTVTVNISEHGTELSGVQARLNLEETIGLSYDDCSLQHPALAPA
jgi:hypothetical protein